MTTKEHILLRDSMIILTILTILYLGGSFTWWFTLVLVLVMTIRDALR